MTWVLVGGLLGACLTPPLVHRGLRQLRWRRRLPRWSSPLFATAGALVGIAAAWSGPGRTDPALLPALGVWVLALTALALCDAIALRIPTPLLRQATVLVVVFWTVGAAVTGAMGPWARAFGGAVLMGAVFAAAWRYGEAGKADVRLALLGGLGLGFASWVGLVLGLVAWAMVVATQASVSRLRGGSVKTQIALAPGVTAGLLIAALCPT